MKEYSHSIDPNRLWYYTQLVKVTAIPLEKAYLDNQIAHLNGAQTTQELQVELVIRATLQHADMDLIKKNLSQKLNSSYQNWMLSQEAPE